MNARPGGFGGPPVDRWVGATDSRVRWPGDPIGCLDAWLDERWPAVESGAQRRIE